MSRPLLNSADEHFRLMMLCGFQVALKFLLGRMLDVIRSQGADQAQIYEYAP